MKVEISGFVISSLPETAFQIYLTDPPWKKVQFSIFYFTDEWHVFIHKSQILCSF